MTNRIFLSIGLVLSLLTAADSRAATDSPAMGKVIVILQGFGAGCTDCLSIVGGLILLEDRARAKEAARVYEAIKMSMPDFDAPNAIRSSLCKHLFAAQDEQCDRVVIAGQADKRGELTNIKADPNDIVVKFVIEFPRNAFQVIASVSQVAQDGKPRPADLYAWHNTPPETKLRAAPFDAITKRNEANVSAAKDYWLEGDPSLLEQHLKRSFEELAEIVKLSVPHVFAEHPPSTQWWVSMPKIQELKDSGRIDCPRYMCSLPYLKVTQDRLWHVQYAGRDVVIMSVPQSIFAK